MTSRDAEGALEVRRCWPLRGLFQGLKARGGGPEGLGHHLLRPRSIIRATSSMAGAAQFLFLLLRLVPEWSNQLHSHDAARVRGHEVSVRGDTEAGLHLQDGGRFVAVLLSGLLRQELVDVDVREGCLGILGSRPRKTGELLILQGEHHLLQGHSHALVHTPNGTWHASHNIASGGALRCSYCHGEEFERGSQGLADDAGKDAVDDGLCLLLGLQVLRLVVVGVISRFTSPIVFDARWHLGPHQLSRVRSHRWHVVLVAHQLAEEALVHEGATFFQVQDHGVLRLSGSFRREEHAIQRLGVRRLVVLGSGDGGSCRGL
mmetsp:Transcript_43747/g.93657  ORF Transcript_43747/g.93657 Transcript_43747/m.93657 type:complete len:318 (+) Transcript_43747:1092-2045(+)